jgi:MFS family permease
MGHGEINYDAIPGNSYLVDLDGHMTAARHSDKDSHIVLIPTPSDDPDDPLNWTKKRKWLSLFCMVVYTYAVGIPSAAIYSILPNISEANGITLAQLNAGTGYMFLFLGIGCFIFQPLALQYGKRPVYLFSTISTALICIWSPFCTTNSAWIGSKILQGLLSSPIESLCEITVSDVSFQHELSRNMALYAMSLLTSNYMYPFIDNSYRA